MKNINPLVSLEDVISCLSSYDPDSIRVDEAQDIINTMARGSLTSLAVEKVSLRSTLGRILARDIISPVNVPYQDNAAMDGYAFNGSIISDSDERLVTLENRGVLLAGRVAEGVCVIGECFQIMTGAPMPHNTDTVVPQEFIEKQGQKIKFLRTAVAKGDNRRKRGEDLKKDSVALQKGRIIRACDLGLLASLGLVEIEVYRKLRIAFFSTGDELRSIGDQLNEGGVYDSNRYSLYGMLTKLGFDLLDMGVIADNSVDLKKAFSIAAKNADAVITTGGVSVGDADYTKEVMKELGKVEFWKIAMRPGRPMAFGQIVSNRGTEDENSALLFGLPGNPVAVMITFYIFVQYALLQMAGSNESMLKMQSVKLRETIKKKPGRIEYRRAKFVGCDNALEVVLTGHQGSGILRSMTEADCLIVLEHDREKFEAGNIVPAFIFDGLI